MYTSDTSEFLNFLGSNANNGFVVNRHMTITANPCYDAPLVGGSCTNSPFVGGKGRSFNHFAFIDISVMCNWMPLQLQNVIIGKNMQESLIVMA